MEKHGTLFCIFCENVWAISVEADQTPPEGAVLSGSTLEQSDQGLHWSNLIRIYTVCHSINKVNIFCTLWF